MHYDTVNMFVFVLFIFLVRSALYCSGEVSSSSVEVGDYPDEIDAYPNTRAIFHPLGSASHYNREVPLERRRKKNYNYGTPQNYGRSSSPGRGNNRKAESYRTSYSYETTDKPKYFSYSYGRSSKNSENNGDPYYSPGEDFDESHPDVAVDLADDVQVMRRPKVPSYQSLLDVSRKVRPR